MKSFRIGFLVCGNTVPAWYADTIKTVDQAGHELFFISTSPSQPAEKTPVALTLFNRFERWWFRSKYDALQLVTLFPYLTATNSMQFQDGMLLPEMDLVYMILPPSASLLLLLPQLRFGFWWVEFGPPAAGEKLSGFWEVMNDEPVSQSRLLVCKNGVTKLAYDGSTRTVPYSVRNNQQSLAWKAAGYLALRLKTLQTLGETYLDNLPLHSHLPMTARLPRNAEMIRLAIRNAARYLRYKIARKKADRFTLLYSHNHFNLDAFGTLSFSALALPNTDNFIADPFVAEDDGRSFVFAEEWDAAKNKAHISVISFDANNRPSAPQPVLEQAYHLSYPHVFLHDGEWYMIPESAANKTIELYKAIEFPFRWTKLMNLMEGVELFDATVLFEKGRWWLFAGGYTHPFTFTNDQLFLYSADTLFSTTWIPHPLNPVATVAQNCRPAGRIFRQGGKIYRPAQNNASQQYGYGLQVNEITVLSETVYEEILALSILPETLNLRAIHHLDFSGSLTVIDGIPS